MTPYEKEILVEHIAKRLGHRKQTVENALDPEKGYYSLSKEEQLKSLESYVSLKNFVFNKRNQTADYVLNHVDHDYGMVTVTNLSEGEVFNRGQDYFLSQFNKQFVFIELEDVA